MIWIPPTPFGAKFTRSRRGSPAAAARASRRRPGSHTTKQLGCVRNDGVVDLDLARLVFSFSFSFSFSSSSSSSSSPTPPALACAVVKCEPEVHDVQSLVDALNTSNDFSAFVRNMRKRFQQLVPPARNMHTCYICMHMHVHCARPRAPARPRQAETQAETQADTSRHPVGTVRLRHNGPPNETPHPPPSPCTRCACALRWSSVPAPRLAQV